MAYREIRDPVHGFIPVNELESAIIDTTVFQRLRRIRQLALANLVYPGASHTRFEHSIGAMHVAGRIATSVGLSREEVRLVRITALLHDLGHGPFSHVLEPVLQRFAAGRVATSSGKIHEGITRAILLRNPELAHLLSPSEREKLVGILGGEFGDSMLKEIVSGPLDADKQDYLLRDSYYCGVKYGIYDLDRLLQTLVLFDDSGDRYLGISPDGVYALEQFVLAKYYMTTQVYMHRVRLITDAMIQRGLELGVEADGIDWLRELLSFSDDDEFLDEYLGWHDERVLDALTGGGATDGYARDIFSRLARRRLFKQIAAYSSRQFPEPLVREALAGLPADRWRRLEARIGEYLGVDPNLVIVHAYELKSVREQSRNSEGSIMVMGPDKKEKFEAHSTLFLSIDEAVRERRVEIYAPMDYKDEKDKRQRRAQFVKDIQRIIAKGLAGPGRAPQTSARERRMK